MSSASAIRNLQLATWSGSLPLEIRLAPRDCRTFDQADPYLIHYHRLSYLPFLLPRLRAFFATSLIDASALSHTAWFSFEGVPLKWHHPLGLLHDLFAGTTPTSRPGLAISRAGGGGGSSGVGSEDKISGVQRPWRLEVHYSEWPDEQLVRLDSEGRVLHDAFINAVKEADFLRNGSAKAIMALSKKDSTGLWQAVEHYDMAAFNMVQSKLLASNGPPVRHIPVRVYLPASTSASDVSMGHLKVVQALVTPTIPNSREAQTLGMALHTLLPSLFPSRRTPIIAKPVLHGAIVPMAAVLEDLLRGCAYLDGWLHFGIEMMV